MISFQERFWVNHSTSNQGGKAFWMIGILSVKLWLVQIGEFLGGPSVAPFHDIHVTEDISGHLDRIKNQSNREHCLSHQSGMNEFVQKLNESAYGLPISGPNIRTKPKLDGKLQLDWA